MFEEIALQMIELISENGIAAVMLGMVIEEVVVPIPSPVIPMAAGAILIESTTFLGAAFHAFFYIALPASIASVVSSYFVFAIAYYGGKPVIEKYGRWLDIKWEDIQKVEEHFDSGNEKYYVALFRAIPIVPLSLISGSAGLFRMDWREYGIWSFIGMMPRNFILAMFGWYAGDGFRLLASRIDTASTWVLLVIVGAVGCYILYQKLQDLADYILDKI
jgi:membrane protein DedA with SNARE-associated domain